MHFETRRRDVLTLCLRNFSPDWWLVWKIPPQIRFLSAKFNGNGINEARKDWFIFLIAREHTREETKSQFLINANFCAALFRPYFIYDDLRKSSVVYIFAEKPKIGFWVCYVNSPLLPPPASKNTGNLTLFMKQHWKSENIVLIWKENRDTKYPKYAASEIQ